jgi:CheY-like chemotaxis protein
MPGIGGVDVLRRLRADPGTTTVPVLVCTSKEVEPEEARELRALGAALLSKLELSRPDAVARLRSALAGAVEAAPARTKGEEAGSGDEREGTRP